jgi:imidazolonepropionase-like amidohydrolase
VGTTLRRCLATGRRRRSLWQGKNGEDGESESAADATLTEMARRGTFYVPTIDHNRYYAENREAFGYGPEVAERLNGRIRRNLETTRRAHGAGVRIAMGADAVFTMFGQNTRELEWFVKAGMTPEQALATATTNAAALLGKEKDLGAVAPGYFADLVAVEGGPLADIGNVINGVRWVMKGGSVVVDKTESENRSDRLRLRFEDGAQICFAAFQNLDVTCPHQPSGQFELDVVLARR